MANGDIRRGTLTTRQAPDLQVTSQHFSKGAAGACLIGTGSENAAYKDRVTHARPQQLISSIRVLSVTCWVCHTQRLWTLIPPGYMRNLPYSSHTRGLWGNMHWCFEHSEIKHRPGVGIWRQSRQPTMYPCLREQSWTWVCVPQLPKDHQGWEPLFSSRVSKGGKLPNKIQYLH